MITQQPDSLIRPEVLEHHAAAGQRGGDVLRLDPAATTRRAHWLLLLLFTVGFVCLVAVKVPWYAEGPAVIWLDRVFVTADAPGTVRSVDIVAGQKVKRGDALVHFCDAREAAELQRVEQAYELQLVNNLRDPLDQATRQELTSLRTQRTLARAIVKQRRLTAPHDGTVGDVRIRPGEHFAAGDVLLSLCSGTAAPGEPDIPLLIAMLPAHDAPFLEAGMDLRLELSGHRYSYAKAKICEVDREASGPATIQRYLGQQIGDALALQGPLVLVRARLEPGSRFEANDGSYEYRHGMHGTARVRVRSEYLLGILLPRVKELFGNHNLPATPILLGVVALLLLLVVWAIRQDIARRIRRFGHPPIPFVAQADFHDGSAACLAMAFGALGQKATPADIAQRVGAEPGSVIDMHEAAYCFGLACRETRLGVGTARVGDDQDPATDLGLLRHVPRGSILELGGQPVVLERVTSRTVIVVDPCRGRLCVPIELFARSSDRRVLTFEPLAIRPQDRQALLEEADE